MASADTNNNPAVACAGLTHRYGDRVALDGVDLEVRRGEVFALLGPNGGGKSTMFRILSTLLQPSSGRASVFGLDVVTSAHQVRRRIGALFQSPSLDGKLTVAENLKHHGHLYGMHSAALLGKIDEVMEAMGLTDRASDRADTLSGGLQRRVEIAMSLVHSPQLLLLDEPGTGLDPSARRSVREQLERLRRESGVTSILTTHLMDEADTCDRVAILDHGRLVALDTPAALKSSVGGDVVTLLTTEPESVCSELEQQFGIRSQRQGQSIRFEHANGPELTPKLAAAFGDKIQSLAVGKPTLDDVFFTRTGQRLDDGAG